MTDESNGAPATPASARALRGPSEESAALEARAAAARAEEADAAAARRAEADREREKEQRAKERESARARRAPTHFARSMRFFFWMMAGLLASTVAVVNALEGQFMPWRPLGMFAAVWGVVGVVLWLDSVLWRRRLPFSLDGFDAIDGTDRSGDSEAPWVAFEVAVLLASEDSDARAARTRVMEILASRVNAMINKDGDLKPTTGQRWRVNETTGALRGESTLAIYTTRMIEKWLRDDVTLLARAHPVTLVRVRARYTGSSSRIPD